MHSLPDNFTPGPQSTTDEHGNIIPLVDWIRMRLGCVTASRIEDAAFGFMQVGRKGKDGNPDKKKGDPTAERIRYMKELSLQTIGDKAPEHYVSRWMKDGINREPDAKTAYEVQCGVFVQQICFVQHREINRAGASPDGLVILSEPNEQLKPGEWSRYKLLEVKCPKWDTHYDYWLAQANGSFIPLPYVRQMQWQMACAGPECLENDFVSYHPEFPDDMQLLVVPLRRDNKLIAEMEAGVKQFLAELIAFEQEVAQLRTDRANNVSTIERKLRESLRQQKPNQSNVIPIVPQSRIIFAEDIVP